MSFNPHSVINNLHNNVISGRTKASLCKLLNRISQTLFISCVQQTLIMKDRQLERFLQPTTDMKKAIGRNAKEEEGLTIAIRQIETEKRLALDHLSRKQDAFVKRALKRRESLSSNFKVPFLKERQMVVGEDNLSPDETSQARRLRSSSFEETSSSVSTQKTSNLKNRLILPPLVSGIRCHNENDMLTLKTGVSELTPSRHTLIDSKYSIVSSSRGEMNAKVPASTIEPAIRRHSTVTTTERSITGYETRLLQRRPRAATLPIIVAPDIQDETEN